MILLLKQERVSLRDNGIKRDRTYDPEDEEPRPQNPEAWRAQNQETGSPTHHRRETEESKDRGSLTRQPTPEYQTPPRAKTIL